MITQTTFSSIGLEKASIEICVEQNLARCEEIWELLSPHHAMADLWAYRSMWNVLEGGQPFFLIALHNGNPIGLLPLAYFSAQQEYWWFGGGFWIERSRVFIKQEWRLTVLPLLYRAVPKNSKLFWIEPTENSSPLLGSFDFLAPQMNTFFLMLSSLKGDIENLYSLMSTESGKSIRRSIRKLKDLYHPEITYGTISDLECLINFNIQRFGADSTMHDFTLRTILSRMISTPEVKDHVHILNISIENRIVASTLVFFYKGVYTFYQGGCDPNIADLNKFHVYALLQDALNLGAERFDALGEDCGWKERWHFEKAMLWQFTS